MTFEQVKQRAIERALDTLTTPARQVILNHEMKIVRSSRQVLDCENMTFEQAAAEPALLISGDAYDGGSTAKMDPFHPVSAALNELRFAACDTVELRKPQLLVPALDRAEAALRAHGVPKEIAWISTRGRNAYLFEPSDVVALMPGFRPPEGTITVSPPVDRASATPLIMGALAGMPADHPARPAIETYVRMVANPTVPTVLLKPYVDQVVTALMEKQQLSRDDLT